MPPSQLQIATSSLQRLVKEEASYHKELESQKKRIAELETQKNDEDENREFKLKQEVGPTNPRTIDLLAAFQHLPTPKDVCLPAKRVKPGQDLETFREYDSQSLNAPALENH